MTNIKRIVQPLLPANLEDLIVAIVEDVVGVVVVVQVGEDQVNGSLVKAVAPSVPAVAVALEGAPSFHTRGRDARLLQAAQVHLTTEKMI